MKRLSLVLILTIITKVYGQFLYDPNSVSHMKADIKQSPYPPQRSESIIGTISPGETQSHSIPIDKASKASICCFWKTGNLNFTLIDPQGNRVDPTSTVNDGFIMYEADSLLMDSRMACYILLLEYLTGTWAVEVIADDIPDDELGYSINIFFDDPDLIIDIATDKYDYKVSESVILTTILKQNESPVFNANVTAKIALPDSSIETISLFDNGTHGDETTDDGSYTTTFTRTSQTGLYNMLITANESTLTPFSRETYISFNVIQPKAQFLSSFDENVVDSNQDSFIDELTIDVSLSVSDSSEYRITAQLFDKHEREIENDVIKTFLIPGIHTLRLSFDGRHIYKNRVDGPFTIKNLRLSKIGLSRLFFNDKISYVLKTQPYSYRDFQRDIISCTGNSSIKAKDDNGNEIFDFIILDVEVDIAVEDNYEWYASIYDDDYNFVAHTSHEGFLSEGISIVSFTFDGAEINESGINGPYVVKSLRITNKKGDFDVNKKNITTLDYWYNDFE